MTDNLFWFAAGAVLASFVFGGLQYLEGRGLWHGIAWGGEDTEHPGWWLWRNKRITDREWRKM